MTALRNQRKKKKGNGAPPSARMISQHQKKQGVNGGKKGKKFSVKRIKRNRKEL